jgi:primosomal protein N'
VTAKTEATTVRKIREAARNMGPNVIVSTPMPVFHERSVGGYSWQVIVRARNRGALVKALSSLGPDFKITLDPPTLL